MTIPLRGIHDLPAPAAATPRTRESGLLRRWLDAVIESRDRRATEVADAYLTRSGYRLTDSIEREIGDRLLGDSRKFRP